MTKLNFLIGRAMLLLMMAGLPFLLWAEGSGNWTQGVGSGHQTQLWIPSYTGSSDGTNSNTGYATRGFMMLPTNYGYNASHPYDPGMRFYVYVKNGETVYWGFHRGSGNGNITATWYYDNRTDDGTETGSHGFYPNATVPGNITQASQGTFSQNAGTGCPGSEAAARTGPNQVAGSGGYQAYSFTNNTGADRAYWIELNTGNFQIDYWDVTVVSGGVVQPGRLYCKYWSIYNGLPSGTMGVPNNTSFHPGFGFYVPVENTYTPGTYFVKYTNFGNSNGGYTVFFANTDGPRDDGAYAENRKSVLGTSNNFHFPLFVGIPDSTLWLSSVVPIANTSVSFSRRPDPNPSHPADPGPGGQASFTVTVDNPGIVDILVDIIGNNYIYDPGDVILTENFDEPGTYEIYWNGKDGNGNNVPSGTPIQFKTSVLFFPVHFPIYDMEQSMGITIKNVRPGNPTNQLIYWDDSYIAAAGTTPANSQQSITVNVTGTPSPDHIWYATGDNGFSNNRTINTWSGGYMQIDSAVFVFNWDAAEVSLRKMVDNATPIVGNTVNFKLIVTNEGLMDALDAEVTDTLPSGYSYVSSENNGIGTVTVADGNKIKWIIDTIPFSPLPNLTRDTLVITATVLPTGDYNNKAEVVTNGSDDPNPGNNIDSATITPIVPRTISGTVYNDNDGNIPDGNTMANITVTLYDNNGNTIITTTTDGDGHYTFPGLIPGDYTIAVIPPTGYENVSSTDNITPRDGSTPVTISSADMPDVDFGINEPPTAHDDSATGPQGTPVVVTSTLDNDNDPNNGILSDDSINLIPPAGVTVDGVTTGPGGDTISFHVSNEGTWAVDGNGNVTFTPDNGFMGDPDPIQYTVTDQAGLPSNPATLTVHYTYTIGGTVYNDHDGGIPDGDAMGNVAITLYDNNGSTVATTITDVDGHYVFPGLISGIYTIVVTPPAGYENISSTDATTPKDGNTSITIIGANVPDVDFGINQPPVSDIKDASITAQPQPDDVIALDGTGANGEAPLVTGNDAEDGSYTGMSNNDELGAGPAGIVITTLPDNGILLYHGNPVAAGDTITNLSALSIQLTGSGYTSVMFKYAYIDATELQGTPATYTLHWGSPLPITLVSFTAAAIDNNKVVLDWITAMETNNKGFEVEHSTNGREWNRIAFVNSNATNGNSNEQLSYHFNDNKPTAGDNYYRLKQLGFDGRTQVSIVRVVRITAGNNIRIYPNPAKDMVNIEVATSVSVKAITITDANGKIIFSIPSYINKIDLSSYASGVYYLRIITDEGTQAFMLNKM